MRIVFLGGFYLHLFLVVFPVPLAIPLVTKGIQCYSSTQLLPHDLTCGFRYLIELPISSYSQQKLNVTKLIVRALPPSMKQALNEVSALRTVETEEYITSPVQYQCHLLNQLPYCPFHVTMDDTAQEIRQSAFVDQKLNFLSMLHDVFPAHCRRVLHKRRAGTTLIQ